MLAEDLQKEISALSSALKENLSFSLTKSVQPFLVRCEELKSQYSNAGKPTAEEVYEAVSLYLKGQISPDADYLYAYVAFGLYVPMDDVGLNCIAADRKRLEVLLNRYRVEIKVGQLWEMVWLAILEAYFYPPIRAGEQETILGFLKETYPAMVAQLDHKPKWVRILDSYPDLLSREPCRSLAPLYLRGQTEKVHGIASEMGVAGNSWFWRDLVRASIKYATDKPDDDFKALIPQLLLLIESRPDYLDEDLNAILYRYQQCLDKSAHDELKAFSLRYWKNPKLRFATGSKWLQVREPVWHMVLDWVNEHNQRVFFQILSTRRHVGEDRLAAWLRYIEWTKRIVRDAGHRYVENHGMMMELFTLEEAIITAGGDPEGRKMDLFLNRMHEYLAKS